MPKEKVRDKDLHWIQTILKEPDMETTEILFALLRSAVCGEERKEEVKKACTPEKLEAVYTLAKRHDLAHLVAHALEGLDIPDCEVLTKLKNAKMRAIYRYARMDLELEHLRQILEGAQIPFIPLKGSVLRQYYPEPWMRTSGDIDVLVKEADFDRAVETLQKQGWKTEGPVQFQNICVRSPSGILLELHFNIRVKMEAADAVLDDVWLYCKPIEGEVFEHHQTDAFFLLHHVAHMAKHILVGGCGIRPFLDLWVMRSLQKCNESDFYQLCRNAQLEIFAREATGLANVWFGNASYSDLSKRFETYVLDGGVYGSLSNKVVMSQLRIGGKMKNLWNRLFVPLHEMQQMYPILKSWIILLPVFHLVRWYQVVTSGRMKKAVAELRLNQSSSESQIREAEVFIKNLGL